ncbi:MAG: FAD-dependent oxidoreductase [Phycisphaerales bacterium]
MPNTPTILPTPSLRDDDILAIRCGIRPHRRGSVRVEPEHAFGKHIVHNYGHGGAGVTLSWGTAEAAAGLVAREAREVAVLGAGVVGLTAAHELARSGRRVRVYAREVAHQTVSALAGALWLPTGVAWGQTDPERARFMGWLLAAKRRFLAQMDEGAWGVRTLPVWEPGTSQQDARFFRDGIVEDWRVIDRLPLAGTPGGGEPGQAWTALFIDTPVFLDRLLADLRAAGVEFVERAFDRAEQIADLPEPAVVNCLGLGAREVWNDAAMLPVRGHLLHLRPQAIDYIYHANYTYMFPRSSALVLGGSYEEGVEDPRVDESICRRILEKHRQAHAVS